MECPNNPFIFTSAVHYKNRVTAFTSQFTVHNSNTPVKGGDSKSCGSGSFLAFERVSGVSLVARKKRAREGTRRFDGEGTWRRCKETVLTCPYSSLRPPPVRQVLRREDRVSFKSVLSVKNRGEKPRKVRVLFDTWGRGH